MNLLSRSTRVTIMLVFSATLFLLEQIVGYAAGSIALVADSFHMLNDMLSLAVALYAIKIAAYRESVPRNTYGWQRAEILGALFNGVLLLGLCLTIYTEAIQRFIDPVPVSNPKLVLVTGCTGMLFNVIGLWLFGDLHGHGHGHDHDHGRHHHRHGSEELQRQASSPAVGHLAHGIPTEAQPLLPQSSSSSSSPADGYHHHHAVHLTPSSASASTSSSTTDLEASRSYYPPYAQQSIVNAAQIQRSMLDREDAHDHEHEHDTGSGRRGNKGHLNMHGVWLHVFGDCLANLAVIASAAFIWLTDYSWRFYIDPVVSIIINTIVVAAVLPLVKSTSFILLQGVPTDIDTKRIRARLLKLNNVLDVHELHIWQLSDTKYVASVHILIGKPASYSCLHKESSAVSPGDAHYHHRPASGPTVAAVQRDPAIVDMDCVYMDVAASAQKVLHDFGIHSTTIQPEFLIVPNSSPHQLRKVPSDQCLNQQAYAPTVAQWQPSNEFGRNVSASSSTTVTIVPCLLNCQSGLCDSDRCCDLPNPIQLASHPRNSQRSLHDNNYDNVNCIDDDGNNNNNNTSSNENS